MKMFCNSWSGQNYFPELSKVQEISYAHCQMCHNFICNRTNKIALLFLEQFYIHSKLKALKVLIGSLTPQCTNFPHYTTHTFITIKLTLANHSPSLWSRFRVHAWHFTGYTLREGAALICNDIRLPLQGHSEKCRCP